MSGDDAQTNPHTEQPDHRLRVLVMDERPVFRIGVQHILMDDPEVGEVDGAGSLPAAEPLLQSSTFDVVVTGSPEDDPVAANARFCRLARRAGDAHIVCLSSDGHPTPPRCGRFTVIPETSLSHRIRKAVDDAPTAAVAMRFHCQVTASCAAEHTHQSPLPELTGQESRVLSLLLEGLHNREIAERMGIAEKTVKNYLSRVFDKLGVGSRAEAIALLTTR